MAKKKKLIVKKKSSVPERNRKKPAVKSVLKPKVIETPAPDPVIETPPVDPVVPETITPEVAAETPVVEPVVEIQADPVVEATHPYAEVETPNPAIETPVIETPAVEVPRRRRNTLLDGLLIKTDKDVAGISETVESIKNVHDEEDVLVDSDGKIEVDDKTLRAEARLEAVLHVSGVSWGLQEIGNLVFQPTDQSRYMVNQKGKEQYEKNLGDYYYLKAKIEKKRRKPGSALVWSALTLVGPILFAMVIDGIKKYRERSKREAIEAQEKVEREQNRMIEMFERFKSQGQPEAQVIEEIKAPVPGSAPRVVTKGPVIKNGQKQNGGRHKLTCPRAKDKNGVCNCR